MARGNLPLLLSGLYLSYFGECISGRYTQGISDNAMYFNLYWLLFADTVVVGEYDQEKFGNTR